jgi:hypothetical protein
LRLALTTGKDFRLGDQSQEKGSAYGLNSNCCSISLIAVMKTCDLPRRQANKHQIFLGSNRIAVAQWLNSSKVTAHRSARKYLPIECIFAAFARLADAPLEERIRLWRTFTSNARHFVQKCSLRETRRAQQMYVRGI